MLGQELEIGLLWDPRKELSTREELEPRPGGGQGQEAASDVKCTT